MPSWAERSMCWSPQSGTRTNRSTKPSTLKRVASAINTYADAAETLATTIQRLRPQLEKLPADEPEACKAANRRLEAFQPEINAVIEKLDYKRRRYTADPGVTNAWRRLINITKG